VVPDFHPSQVVHLGGTLTLVATEEATTGLQTAALHVTLDQVIDPAPDGVGSAVPSLGYRNVGLKVTIVNVGDVTVPSNDEGDDGIPSLQWALDPNITEQYGAPVYGTEDFPSESCGNTPKDFPNGVLPGQSVTGCVLFYGVPDRTAITSASALLTIANTNAGIPGEWLVP
jgi:hypothetical protein